MSFTERAFLSLLSQLTELQLFSYPDTYPFILSGIKGLACLVHVALLRYS